MPNGLLGQIYQIDYDFLALSYLFLQNYLLFGKQLYTALTESIYILYRMLKNLSYNILSQLGMPIFKYLVALHTLNYINGLRFCEKA